LVAEEQEQFKVTGTPSRNYSTYPNYGIYKQP
jgi:hypothetical protein